MPEKKKKNKSRRMGIGSDEVGLKLGIKLNLDKYHVRKCVTFVRTGCPLKKISFSLDTFDGRIYLGHLGQLFGNILL